MPGKTDDERFRTPGRSISTTLFRSIFGYYCAAAVIITVFHLGANYFSIKSQMRQSILRYQHSLEKTLTKELWHLDRNKNRATLEGISSLPFVAGASVHLPDGSVFNQVGTVSTAEKQSRIWEKQTASGDTLSSAFRPDLYDHSFELIDDSIPKAPEVIGHVHLYSSAASIHRQMLALSVPVVVAALFKTTILWLLFIYVINRRLGRPLQKLVMFVGGLPIEGGGEGGIAGEARRDDINELELLEQTLEQMSGRLLHTLEALKEESLRYQRTAENLRVVNEKIEITIKERTSDLELTNSRLTGEIAARRQTEAELAASNTELSEALMHINQAQSTILQQEKMASIGQLAAGVAHEINNPMGFILSNLNTLGKYAARLLEFQRAQTEAVGRLAAQFEAAAAENAGLDGLSKSLKIQAVAADIEDLLAESIEGGERVKKIVQNLKGFARLDESEVKPADLNQCLDSTLNIVWNELKYKCTVVRDYGEIPLLSCNPGQLNQVFMNLLVNAGQAIEKEGEIRIETRQDDEWVVVSIADNGRGIEADKLSRIFEPFFTTKEVGKGIGLGLSIAYDIVKSHHGDLTVESEPGRGTRFCIRLPLEGAIKDYF